MWRWWINHWTASFSKDLKTSLAPFARAFERLVEAARLGRAIHDKMSNACNVHIFPQTVCSVHEHMTPEIKTKRKRKTKLVSELVIHILCCTLHNECVEFEGLGICHLIYTTKKCMTRARKSMETHKAHAHTLARVGSHTWFSVCYLVPHNHYVAVDAVVERTYIIELNVAETSIWCRSVWGVSA